MSPNNFIQAAFFLIVVLLMVKPLGTYMARIYEGSPAGLNVWFASVERWIYRLCGVEPEEGMSWKTYAFAMILFNVLGVLVVYAIQRLQAVLPLNPMAMPAVSPDLSFNTAVSFASNTNWQSYGGESTMSYLTQMLALVVQNFVSAATGMAILVAIIRGFVQKQINTIGNFWVDLVRSVLYILLPLSLVFALALSSQGIPQTFHKSAAATLLQATKDSNGKPVTEQDLALGPVASQISIKQLGSNGGGFYNVNSAHPYENPTPLSNFLELLAIMLIPVSLCYTFGVMVGNTRQGWMLLGVMLVILVGCFGVLQGVESSGNPLVAKLGVQSINMEGKEVRFGMAGSNLFTVATTGTSCGAVNTMHDSLTPIGGMIPLSLILLGEIIFGGVGSGLYTMLAFAIIAVFVSGLMIGRTPEYLGKKIEVREMWMSILVILTAGITVLILSGIAMITPQAVASMANPGAHGLSEVLYAVASMANNNGSAFAGLNANVNFFNLFGYLAMTVGRYVPAIAVLAMAGSLAEKKYVPPSLGTLPTDKAPFAIWLTLVILIVGALTFFPALALGPIVEHLMMVGT